MVCVRKKEVKRYIYNTALKMEFSYTQFFLNMGLVLDLTGNYGVNKLCISCEEINKYHTFLNGNTLRISYPIYKTDRAAA